MIERILNIAQWKLNITNIYLLRCEYDNPRDGKRKLIYYFQLSREKYLWYSPFTVQYSVYFLSWQCPDFVFWARCCFASAVIFCRHVSYCRVWRHILLRDARNSKVTELLSCDWSVIQKNVLVASKYVITKVIASVISVLSLKEILTIHFYINNTFSVLDFHLFQVKSSMLYAYYMVGCKHSQHSVVKQVTGVTRQCFNSLSQWESTSTIWASNVTAPVTYPSTLTVLSQRGALLTEPPNQHFHCPRL